MRFSLRVLFVIVGSLCVSLALTQMNFLMGCACLVGIITFLGFVVDKRTWRCVAYGAVAGICGGFLLMLAFMLYKYGRISASNYQESSELNAIVVSWRSYLVHIGAFVGAIVAVVGKHGTTE